MMAEFAKKICGSGRQYCVICPNYRGKVIEGRTVTLHRLPANETLREAWEQRLELTRRDYNAVKNPRVCSEHFVNKQGPLPDDNVPSVFPNRVFETCVLSTQETGTGNRKPKTKVCWKLSGSSRRRKDPVKPSTLLTAGGKVDRELLVATKNIHGPETQPDPNEPLVSRKPLNGVKPVFLSKASLHPKPRPVFGADAEEEYRIELNPEWQTGDDNNKRCMPHAAETNNSAVTKQELGHGLSAGGCIAQQMAVPVTGTSCCTAWPSPETDSQIPVTSFVVENVCTVQPSAEAAIRQLLPNAKVERFCTEQSSVEVSSHQTMTAFSGENTCTAEFSVEVCTLPFHAEEKVCTANSPSKHRNQQIVPAGLSGSAIAITAGTGASGSTEIRPTPAASRETVSFRKLSSEYGSQKLIAVPSNGMKSSTSNICVGQKIVIVTSSGGEPSSTAQPPQQGRKIILLTPVGKNKTALCQSSDFSGQKLHSVSTGIAGNLGISCRKAISLLNGDVRGQVSHGCTSEFSNKRITLLSGGRENLTGQSAPDSCSQKLFPMTSAAAKNSEVSRQTMLNPGVSGKACTGQTSLQYCDGRIILVTPGGGEKTSGQSSGNCGSKKLVSVIKATADNSGVSSVLRMSALNGALRHKAATRQISAKGSGEKTLSPDILQGVADISEKRHANHNHFICKYCEATNTNQQTLVRHLLTCTASKSVGASPPDSLNLAHLASSSPASVKDEIVQTESSTFTTLKDEEPAQPTSPSPTALKDEDPIQPTSSSPTVLKDEEPIYPASSSPTAVKKEGPVSSTVTVVWVSPKPPGLQARTAMTHNVGTCTQMKPHRIKELVDLPYKCDSCFSRHKELSHLRIHMRIHQKPEINLCSKCGKQFSSLRAFENHIRKHETERPFVCDQCPVAFKYISGLRGHQRLHTGVKLFQCEMCAKQFTSSTHLKRHKLTHTKDGPIKCPECPATFLAPSSFKIHVRVHTGERPYPCRFCHKAFRDTSALNLHTRIHTRQKPFKCETCAASFQHSGGLKQHMQAEHEESSPLTCDHCGIPFGSRGMLKRHLQFHSQLTDKIQF